MKNKFIEEYITYDGSQLSTQFAYRNYGISGDNIIAFIGPVDVNINQLVDLEDVRNQSPIASDEMLNFIIEVFHQDFFATIWMQRLFISILADEISIINKNHYHINRKGDDLFYNNRKLSVSIAAPGTISNVIHTALNTKDTGAPIPISSLSELEIDPKLLSMRVMERFTTEFESVNFASVKVQPLK